MKNNKVIFIGLGLLMGVSSYKKLKHIQKLKDKVNALRHTVDVRPEND